MSTAFSIALSALSANSTAVNVIANNLANLDTTGFKESEVSFQELVNQALGTQQTAPGFGVSPATVTQVFSQGAVTSSTGPYDAAISGNGFFVVNNPATNQQLYTRDGNFQVNSQGELITSSGQTVQGWTSTAGTLNTSGPTGNIFLPTGILQSPVATQNFAVPVSLNASDTVSTTTPNYSVPMQVYDSLGQQQDLTIDFQKTGPGAWTYTVTAPNSSLASPSSPSGTTTVATGALTFDSSGNLLTPAASAGAIPITVSGLADGAANMSFNWNLYDPTTAAPSITQYAGQIDSTGNAVQDGAPADGITSITMGNGGQINAQYSNGQNVVVAQLALAAIQNPASLATAGNNNFQLSEQTSTPSIGLPNTAGRGSVQGGALESSTVDIATEFTNLIVFQRSYEASAKVVTTADTLSEDTINLIPSA
jgi:flagellar hook protein FlgE